MRDYAAAIAAFEKAVEMKKDPHLYALLGGSFVGLNRLDEAEKAFREGHRINPDHQKCLAQLGAVLARRGAIDEAMPLLVHAVALDPSDRQSQRNLNRARRPRGNWFRWFHRQQQN
jgi:tetratricopeptide (TPR) repeat protein